jgi:hypothetical protein
MLLAMTALRHGQPVRGPAGSRAGIAGLKQASGLLESNNAVGLRNSGFPDNSVVCHAYRRTAQVAGDPDHPAGGRDASELAGGCRRRLG